MSGIFAGGGYQFPAAGRGAAAIHRGAPILHATELGPYRATVELVPLEGGRPELCELSARWTGPGRASCSFASHVQGVEAARRRYHELVDAFRAPDARRLERLLGA